MSLFRIGVVSAVVYGLYRFFTAQDVNGGASPRAASATGEPSGGVTDVRNAGPQAMASLPSQWDKQDQADDESFPASDPPASNRFT